MVNGTRCVAEGSEPLLIYSDIERIRALYLRSGRYFPVRNAVKQIHGLDMYGVTKRIYWADHGTDHSGVYSVELNGDDLQPVVNTGLKMPEDVAIDPIGQNIYISDSSLSKIIVCKLDGTVCSVLLYNLSAPRAIALNPEGGYMYWTEWSHKVRL